MIFYSVFDPSDEEPPGYRVFTDRQDACRHARQVAQHNQTDGGIDVQRIVFVPTKDNIMDLWEGRHRAQQRDVIYTAKGK